MAYPHVSATHIHIYSPDMHSQFSAAHHHTNVAFSEAPMVVVVYFITFLILSSNPYICFLQV